MKKSIKWRRSNQNDAICVQRTLRALIFTIATLLWIIPQSAMGGPYDKLCFPQVINVPGPTYLQPPNIDGDISGDLGWTGAVRYVLVRGIPDAPDAIVQGIRDANFLYLSFQVYNDSTYDNEDRIIIAIDPDGNAATKADLRRIHIQPMDSAGNVKNIIKYWTNSGSSWLSKSEPPDGTRTAASISGTQPDVSWSVEVRIPLFSGFSIPSTGDFGLYLNVWRVIEGEIWQRDWPEDAPDITSVNIYNTPDPMFWGKGTLSSAVCNGVWFGPSDIFMSDTKNGPARTPQNKINLTGDNFFEVLLHNSSVDSLTGQGVEAKDIQAKFKIANFGIANLTSFAAVPAAENPTLPRLDIPISGTRQLSTGTWSLSPNEQSQYNQDTTRHQCILVELNSPSAVLVNHSSWTNMYFGPASKVEKSAEIGRGFDQAPSGMTKNQFELLVTAHTEVLRPVEPRLSDDRKRGGVFRIGGQTIEVPSDKMLSQLTYIVNACRHIGGMVDVDGRVLPVCTPAGAYGFTLWHIADSEATWEYTLAGQGLKTLGKNRYSLELDPGKVAMLETKIEAVEPCPPSNFCFQIRRTAGLAGAMGFVFVSPGFTGFFRRRWKKDIKSRKNCG